MAGSIFKEKANYLGFDPTENDYNAWNFLLEKKMFYKDQKAKEYLKLIQLHDVLGFYEKKR